MFWTSLTFLLVVTAVSFWPVLANGFVDYDDDYNFLKNFEFRGLGRTQLAWAWRATTLGVYQPLSWMILEAQYALFGLEPRGYHLASLALHACNSLLVFGLVNTLLKALATADAKRDDPAFYVASALASALYATHPLRTEVVAWASCEPYLVCAFFYISAILVYVRAERSARRLKRVPGYVTALVLFAMALLSKAAAVSLPIVLVALDLYPLGRLDRDRAPGRLGKLLVQKLPFLALSLLFMGLAVWARSKSGPFQSLSEHGLLGRLQAAAYCILFYLYKTMVPRHLMVYYTAPDQVLSEPGGLSTALLGGALAIVVALTVLVMIVRQRWPGAAATWFCYVAILGPYLGLVRPGEQLVADRYSYLAMLPWTVAIAFLLERLLRIAPGWLARIGVVAAALGMVAGTTALAREQSRTWHDTAALWAHVLRNNPRPTPVVYAELGAALMRGHKLPEAISCLETACHMQRRLVETYPDHPGLKGNLGGYLNNLGMTYTALGRYPEGVAAFEQAIAVEQQALAIAPERAVYLRMLSNHYACLGLAQEKMGHFHEAVASFNKARQLDESQHRAERSAGSGDTARSPR